MEELFLKAKNGDTNAFTQIILSMRNDLYKIAKTRITNDDDIEDIIQETIIATYESLKKVKEPDKLKIWIIKILVNKCNKLYRKKYKKDISINEYNLDNYIIMNNQKNIEDDLNFYSLIKDLKYEERIIIILFYMEQYSLEDISKILKMKKNTIKTHLYRGRQNIKNALYEKNDLLRRG